MDITRMLGLVFRDPTGAEYGQIRALGGSLPHELQISSLQPFAEDECGNYFVFDEESVGFWDHETSQVHSLATSKETFISGLTQPSSVSLSPGQVKSVWVSPELAHLINAKPNGRP